MSEIERRLTIDGLPATPGSFAWTASWEGLLFISGVRGIEAATGRPAPTDQQRISLIFEHLARALEAAGSSLRDVLATRVYVTDMQRHRPLVNAAYESVFAGALPTRTIVEVRALNQDDTIEIEVIAARR